MKNITSLEEIHQLIVNNKKTFLSILFIFYRCILFSQSLEIINESDTIYIYIDKSKKHTTVYKPFNDNHPYNTNYLNYKFSTNSFNTIIFASNTYKNLDNYEKGIKNDERIEKKSFLKRNKDIILGIDFFERNGFKNTFNLLYKKTIYLIDKDEIKGRKIKVKQVRMSCLTCFEE